MSNNTSQKNWLDQVSWNEQGLVALIAQGIGTKAEAPLIKQRCEFTKEVK